MDGSAARDAEWAFAANEAVRHRLPAARFPPRAERAPDLWALRDRFDAFLLDAFGVLNVGESAIPGAARAVERLRRAGRVVMVVSNAAGYPRRLLLERLARLGIPIPPEHVLTSRQVALEALAARPRRRLGMMASRRFGREELEHLDAVFLAEDPAAYDAAEEFLLLGSAEWTERRQALLEAAIAARPRPVLVANPDIVAPREGGLSREPGHYAHRLADATGIRPEFFGKPFPGIFEAALARLPAGTPRTRVAMVGDTLQTDILGGAAAGLKTVLVTGWGALAPLDADRAIARSGIVPDVMVPAI